MNDDSDFPEANPGNPTVKNLSNNAFLSFVAGIMGLTILPILGSVLAIILGNRARQELDQNWGTLDGERFAQVGIILGWIGIGFSLLSVCLAGIIIFGALLILTMSVGFDKLGLLSPFVLLIC